MALLVQVGILELYQATAVQITIATNVAGNVLHRTKPKADIETIFLKKKKEFRATLIIQLYF